jgi:hypothetical protein
MLDDKGRQVKSAPPSLPVEVLGIGGVPMAGDTLTVVENEARAREVAAYRQEKATAKRTAVAPSSLENMFSALAAKQTVIEYPVVIKADVQGSTEAIVNALNRLSTDEIKVRVLHSGVGAITESDVGLAQASGAPIVGFNVRPNAKARELIERNKVRMKYFDVIYQLTDDIAKEMAGELGRNASKPSWAAPRSRKSSLRARRTRLPVCSCSKAISARASTRVLPATTSSSARRRSLRCVASRTTWPKCAPVWNAAWCCGHQRHQGGRHARSVRGRRARTHALIDSIHSAKLAGRPFRKEWAPCLHGQLACGTVQEDRFFALWGVP